jgi:SAM-dependent methyltransferase
LNINTYEDYYNYLSQRRLLGLIYRKFYLYPCISRYLKGRVLDVGCGIGDFLSYRNHTIGVDINPFTVTFCKDRGYKAHLINGGYFPFPEESFDGAIMDNVLEHISDPKSILVSVHRVLRHGGIFIVGVPGIKGYNSDYDHKIFYDENTLIKILEDSGFIRSNCIHIPFKSGLLNKHMRQYCIYGIFIKSY